MRTNKPAAWFRMYAEFATDPKVQMLSEIDQRRFLMLLCLRCSNGDVTLHVTEIAFQLRISDQEWADTSARLQAKNLIDEHGKPISWEKRQFSSDLSAERVAKHRKLKKEACNGDVTLHATKSNVPETETETETETEKEVNTLSAAGFESDAPPLASLEVVKTVRVRATRLADDWALPKPWGQWAVDHLGLPADVVRSEGEKFGDFWRARAGKEACKLDWQATWRNWARTAKERLPASARQADNAGNRLFAGMI